MRIVFISTHPVMVSVLLTGKELHFHFQTRPIKIDTANEIRRSSKVHLLWCTVILQTVQVTKGLSLHTPDFMESDTKCSASLSKFDFDRTKQISGTRGRFPFELLQRWCLFVVCCRFDMDCALNKADGLEITFMRTK